MLSTRLTQLIAANQIAGALWVALAAIAFGVQLSGIETLFAVLFALVALGGGVLALRGSRAGIMTLTVVLALQIIRVANASFAWQFYLGATWGITFRPISGSNFGFEGLFSISPWPAGGGSLLELNVTALLAGLFLLFQIPGKRGSTVSSTAPATPGRGSTV